MKSKLILFLFLFSVTCFAQETDRKKLSTAKYAGAYKFGSNPEKEAIGEIIIYPETDSTVLFYIDLNNGAPDFNMGTMYNRVTVIDDKGIFYAKEEYLESGCKWSFYFMKDKLKIETLEEQNSCGFGFGVYADEEYKKVSDKIISGFKSGEGATIRFEDVSPEEFNKQ